MMLAAVSSGHLWAQPWAEKMFETTSHDFRVVGRGAKAEYRFEFTNLYEEDVHVSAVRTSCGCTTPTLTRDTLKTHETAAVVATFNTRSFVGQKSATITVVFDQPYYAEVRLKVTGHIRTDIRFEPSEVAFGELAEGETGEREVLITHHGDPNWRINDVRSHCDDLAVQLAAPEIVAATGRSPSEVRYRMVVRLKDSPSESDFHERLTLVSNDRDFPTTELAVTGRVRPTLSVSPAAVSLGTVRPGETVQRRLVVRGESPFAIRDVACADERMEFEVPEGKKKLHFVKLRFRADDAQPVSHRVRIESDLPGDKSATLVVTGSVAE
jgi:hypothetical protein